MSDIIELSKIKCVNPVSMDINKVYFLKKSKNEKIINSVMYEYPDGTHGWLNILLTNIDAYVGIYENIDRLYVRFNCNLIMDAIHKINKKLYGFVSNVISKEYPQVNAIRYPCRYGHDLSQVYDENHTHEHDLCDIYNSKCHVIMGKNQYTFPQDKEDLKYLHNVKCNCIVSFKSSLPNLMTATTFYCTPKVYHLEICQNTHELHGTNIEFVDPDNFDISKLQIEPLNEKIISSFNVGNIMYGNTYFGIKFEGVYANVYTKMDKNQILINIEKNHLQKYANMLQKISDKLVTLFNDDHVMFVKPKSSKHIKFNMFNKTPIQNNQKFTFLCGLCYGVSNNTSHLWFKVLQYNETFARPTKSFMETHTSELSHQNKKIIVTI